MGWIGAGPGRQHRSHLHPQPARPHHCGGTRHLQLRATAGERDDPLQPLGFQLSQCRAEQDLPTHQYHRGDPLHQGRCLHAQSAVVISAIKDRTTLKPQIHNAVTTKCSQQTDKVGRHKSAPTAHASSRPRNSVQIQSKPPVHRLQGLDLNPASDWPERNGPQLRGSLDSTNQPRASSLP